MSQTVYEINWKSLLNLSQFNILKISLPSRLLLEFQFLSGAKNSICRKVDAFLSKTMKKEIDCAWQGEKLLYFMQIFLLILTQLEQQILTK